MHSEHKHAHTHTHTHIQSSSKELKSSNEKQAFVSSGQGFSIFLGAKDRIKAAFWITLDKNEVCDIKIITFFHYKDQNKLLKYYLDNRFIEIKKSGPLSDCLGI